MVPKRPTDTNVVLEALIGHDDFMNRAMLREATRLPRDRLMMALRHLLHYKAAEAVAVGKELWYMASPQSDTRIKVVAQIKDGITRQRKKKSSQAMKEGQPS